MSELKQKIMDVAGKMQLAGMATVTEDGKPWVRYVMIVTDDNLTMRCATFAGSRKVKQIAANPEVHITCGITDPAVAAPYIQVQGRARFVTDEDERHGLWNEMLGNIFKGPDDPNYGVVIVEPYRIEYCTPGKMEPEVWEK